MAGRTIPLILVFLVACGPSEGQTRPGRNQAPVEEEAGRTDVADQPGEDVGATQERLPPPGQAWVIFGSDTVHAEVARTPEERAQGLMYRESLAKGRGMLFLFDESRIQSFWMKDTFIPLDIAYLDAELRVVDIQAMEPQTTESHPSALPAMFALEVPRGWFEEKGIGVGAQARFIFGPG